MDGDKPQPDVLTLLDLISTNLGAFQAQTLEALAELRADGQMFRAEFIRVRDDIADVRADTSSLKTDVGILKTDVRTLRSDMAAGFARVERRLDVLEGQTP
jgi:hypothetical protein